MKRSTINPKSDKQRAKDLLELDIKLAYIFLDGLALYMAGEVLWENEENSVKKNK